ncbi:hypothetical protein P152DRAFT_382370, partial [Eremomyces bilateralis CBS 781.70]
MVIARRFSITNFAIATTALGFQVFVLYPWHQKLDDDFEKVKQEIHADRQARDRELQSIKDLLGSL